jgi:hypothetical protein
MKTDRFSDSIRRKLESIRPDFSEKDWARMQATLQQATPVPAPDSPAIHQPFSGATSVWSSQPWLMAAAAVSTAVLISVAVWQRTQINDLRSQLSAKQPATSVQPAPLPTVADAPAITVNEQTSPSAMPASGKASPLAKQTESAATRPDTVYITRYVAVPTPSGPAQNRIARRSANDFNEGVANPTDGNESVAGGTDQRQRVSRPATPDRSREALPNGVPATELTTDEAKAPVESVTRPERRVAGTAPSTSVPDDATRTTPYQWAGWPGQPFLCIRNVWRVVGIGRW